jgi:hypothetical protein
MRPNGSARAASACADGHPQIERFGGQLDNDHKSVYPATQSAARRGGARSGRPGAARDALRASGPVDFAAINKAALAAFPAVLARVLPGGKRVGAVTVKNGADIPRALKNLHGRLWLGGFGYFIVGAIGQLLDRSLIDSSVGDPERRRLEHNAAEGDHAHV